MMLSEKWLAKTLDDSVQGMYEDEAEMAVGALVEEVRTLQTGVKGALMMLEHRLNLNSFERAMRSYLRWMLDEGVSDV